jgi:hypothetical protein
MAINGKTINTAPPATSILKISHAETAAMQSINAMYAGFPSLLEPDSNSNGFGWSIMDQIQK